jgi:phage shock protein PspC (stress-responsive transcriptional regulator)
MSRWPVSQPPGHHRYMSQQNPPPDDNEPTQPFPPTGATQAPPAPDDAAPAGAAPSSEQSGNRFFAWLRGLDVPRQPGWIGGVCAGIAARLGIDPLIVRGIVVVIAVLGGPALLLYSAAWLLLPDYKDRIHLEEAFRGKFDAAVIGIGVVFLLAVLPFGQGFWIFGPDYWGTPGWVEASGSVFWTLLVIGLLIAFVVWLARRAGRASEPFVAPTAKPGDPNADYFAAPKSDALFSAASASSTLPYPTTPLDGPPQGPATPPPGVGAPPEEVAAWRERQAQWKQQHDAYRQQLAGQKQAANRAAQDRARAERVARYNEDRAARLRTRSHPLYSFVVIGLALIAGALVALANAGATVSFEDVVLGLATAVAVLAVGIVVNGVRGKRSGGASGFASVLVAALIVLSIVPHGPHFRYGFDVAFTPTNTAGTDRDTYVAGIGDATFDLSEYYSGSDEVDVAGQVDELRLLAGVADVTVVLPEDEFVRLTLGVGAGDAVTRNGSGVTDALYSNTVTEYLPSGETTWDPTARALEVEVQLGAGTITVIDPNEGPFE